MRRVVSDWREPLRRGKSFFPPSIAPPSRALFRTGRRTPPTVFPKAITKELSYTWREFAVASEVAKWFRRSFACKDQMSRDSQIYDPFQAVIALRLLMWFLHLFMRYTIYLSSISTLRLFRDATNVWSRAFIRAKPYDSFPFFLTCRASRPNYVSFFRVDVHESARSRALNPINRYRAPVSASLLRRSGLVPRTRPVHPGGMERGSEISRRPYKAQTAAIRPLGSNNAAWARLRGVS